MCLFALASLLLIQTFHTHLGQESAYSQSHCPVCTVVHSTRAIAVTQASVFLPPAQIAALANTVDFSPRSQSTELSLFIRPPPQS